MNYSIVIKVFKENNKFFIKIYDVDRENKILNCRNNRRNKEIIKRNWVREEW